MDMIPKADHEAAVAEACAAAATAERERIAAIVNCDAAKDRPAAALRLALTAGATVEVAAAVLATIPSEAQPTAAPHFLGPRSKDAPGGLVLAVESPAYSTGPQAPASDYEHGRSIAKGLGNVQRF